MPRSESLDQNMHCESEHAYIVDQYVEMILLLSDLIVKLGNGVLLANVGSNRDDLAFNTLTVRVDNSLKLLLSTANDVDLCTVHCQSLSGHQANAGATAGYESNLRERVRSYHFEYFEPITCLSLDIEDTL